MNPHGYSISFCLKLTDDYDLLVCLPFVLSRGLPKSQPCAKVNSAMANLLKGNNPTFVNVLCSVLYYNDIEHLDDDEANMSVLGNSTYQWHR